VIIGIGTDVADVGRFTAEASRHGDDLLAAFLTPAELAACRVHPRGPAASAARFAAKEACAKALGTGVFGRLSWQDMELRESGAGATLHLSGRAGQLAAARGVRAIHVSLTRTARLAAAVVVLEG
jgi:holo-[acyl-carrier protein] synthase